MTIDQELELLGRLVGSWVTEATHPMLPGLVVQGTVEAEWLEGKRFLIHRARAEHEDFPDSISVIGNIERDRVGAAQHSGSEAGLCMQYFDSRGVFRAYDVSIDEAAWRIWRDSPGFSQRYTGTFAPDGDTIVGLWELRQDDADWKKDLQITYRRRS
jgi:hypothetical protein